MTKELILKKAIEKAIKNGWKPIGILEMWLDKHIGVHPDFMKAFINTGNFYDLIFSHDFAKAFWGEEIADFQTEIDLAEWQYHLQQIVLEEEPIKYLEQFLD